MEIHGAHGYLLHQFQSPLINTPTDAWGGSEAGRNRLMLAVVDAVRDVIPDSMPLLLQDFGHRLGAGRGGFGRIHPAGPAGSRPGCGPDRCLQRRRCAQQHIAPSPGYQTGFSAAIRAEAGVPTGTVGLLTSAGQAEHAIATGQADGVFMARAALRDPHWWLRAAFELGHDLPWAPQYERAVPRRTF